MYQGSTDATKAALMHGMTTQQSETGQFTLMHQHTLVLHRNLSSILLKPGQIFQLLS